MTSGKIAARSKWSVCVQYQVIVWAESWLLSHLQKVWIRSTSGQLKSMNVIT
jgi:hypothetical protein